MKFRKVLAVICVIAMLCSMAVVAAADENVTEIYSGNTANTGWSMVAEIFTTTWGGTLDPNFITEGGYLSIYFTGTDVYSVHLAMNGASWVQIDREITTATALDDGSYVATISYDDIVAAYGSDFSTLGAVYIYSNTADTGSATVTSVTYTSGSGASAPSQPEIEVPTGGSTEIFSGEASNGAAWTMLLDVLTTPFEGGTLDPAVIDEGGVLAVTYTGNAGQIYLALQDGVIWGWFQIDVPSATETDDGVNVSYYTFEDLAAAYGKDDFSDLGKIVIGSANADNIVLTSIEWLSVHSNDAEDPADDPVDEPEEPVDEPEDPVDEPEEPVEDPEDNEEVPEEPEDNEEVPEEPEDNEEVPEDPEDNGEVPEEPEDNEEEPEDNAGNNTTADTVLFDGSVSVNTSWSICAEIATTLAGGTIDPATLPSDGTIAVYYTADVEGGIYLAMQDATNWGWMQIDEPTSTIAVDGGYVSYFSNEALVAAFGTSDFSDLGKIYIGSGNATTLTITSIVWSSPVADDSNAKTGDEMIVLAAVTMVLMAAAVVTTVSVKKRA